MTTPTTPDQRAEKITVKGRECHLSNHACEEIDGCQEWYITSKPFGSGGDFLRVDGEWRGEIPIGDDKLFAHPTREAAESLIDKHADLPTPPSEPKCPEGEGDKNLNLDHDDALAIHRIVRAMHDGECPQCHAVHCSEDMRTCYEAEVSNVEPVGWRCPKCSFTVEPEEAKAAFQIFAPFMERNLAIFEKWRTSHAK